MSKYKIGDKVKVRKDLKKDNYYGGIVFVPEMKVDVITIKNITRENDCVEAENGLIYSTAMLESLVEEETENDTIEHPEHYTYAKHECIEEMIALFGLDAVIAFCKCNIHKYRYRAAHKNGQEDLDKCDRYVDILLELQKRKEAEEVSALW